MKAEECSVVLSFATVHCKMAHKRSLEIQTTTITNPNNYNNSL